MPRNPETPDPETATIYGLCDPRDGSLRYIGCTTRPLKARLAQHYADGRYGSGNLYRVAWITELRAAGTRPEIFPIEEVPYQGREREEMFWMAYFSAIGCDLLNLKRTGKGDRFGGKEVRKAAWKNLRQVRGW